MLNTEPYNILNKLRNGDDSPIFELYKLHRHEFIAWSKKNFNATEEQAKDAFQDAVIDFHQNVISGHLQELTSSVKSYVFQIGKHKLLNIVKKELRLTYLDTLHVIKNGEFESFMEEEHKAYSQEQISRAIEKLPEDCQKVLKLFYFSAYDMESIARELNYKNADTAKSKKSLCMKNLLKELKKMSMLLVL